MTLKGVGQLQANKRMLFDVIGWGKTWGNFWYWTNSDPHSSKIEAQDEEYRILQ